MPVLIRYDSEGLERLGSEEILHAPLAAVGLKLHISSENRLADALHIGHKSSGEEASGSQHIDRSDKPLIVQIGGMHCRYTSVFRPFYRRDAVSEEQHTSGFCKSVSAAFSRKASFGHETAALPRLKGGHCYFYVSGIPACYDYIEIGRAHV